MRDGANIWGVKSWEAREFLDSGGDCLVELAISRLASRIRIQFHLIWCDREWRFTRSHLPNSGRAKNRRMALGASGIQSYSIPDWGAMEDQQKVRAVSRLGPLGTKHSHYESSWRTLVLMIFRHRDVEEFSARKRLKLLSTPEANVSNFRIGVDLPLFFDTPPKTPDNYVTANWNW